MVAVRPPPGTEPTNVTTPEAGARTADPGRAPTSTPRWSPATYGSSPNVNGCSTGPSAVQAAAGGTPTRIAMRAGSRGARGLTSASLLSWMWLSGDGTEPGALARRT